MRKMRTWRECLIEQLADRESAIAYLQAILEDYQIYKESTIVQRSLLTVVESQGGVIELAKQVGIAPQVLSKMIANEDIPLIDTLGIVLKALGYQLSIQPIKLENCNLDTYSEDRQNTSTYMDEEAIAKS
ncbi:helix-turn-helix domain-containing protein [Candidatus Poribacteria bacterium]|nr:helix-turn-helix domain-containing protein [Candidatus Poribacteria bacterium]MYA70942.1 helix-turn-helix domain-containing protein [Candidatus Poribacteria bacterium]MYH80622.1 helix-turn-helix domain-containing protein [Candidatus Poribacteria bacterium]MYK95423.1 helix-turn-helix domain-containing protein [Candidatus Poribacteria bacterium]